MFVHFQYGRATFMLKEHSSPEEFCKLLGYYIKICNGVNSNQIELQEYKHRIKQLLQLVENQKIIELMKENDVVDIGDEYLFDIILERIVVFPPSQEDLIFKVIDRNGTLTLNVSSVESLEADQPGNNICIANDDPRPAF